MSVSLCMIVRDEESNLEACLESAAGLADELVIVDTGSADGTKDIARRRNAKVIDFPWKDDFSAARNESIRHAVGDWVLWLDADDRIEATSRPKLQALLSALPDTRDGYLMRCVCSAHSGLAVHEVDHVRLFRNDPSIRFRYRVHEQVAPSIRLAGGDLRGTDIVIQHEGYRDAQTYRRKQERNLHLLELECQKHPLDAFMLYYRGAALLDLDRPAEALVSLLLAQRLVPMGTAIARLLPLHLAEAFTREGRADDAADSLRAARAEYPADADLAFALAAALYRAGDLVEADQVLSTFIIVAPQGHRPEVLAGDPSIARFRARHLRAAVRYLQSRYADAAHDSQMVVDAAPEFGDGWLLLADTLFAQGMAREHAAVLDTLKGMQGTEAAQLLITAGGLAMRGDSESAIGLLDRGLLTHGQHPYLLRAQVRLRLPEGPAWMRSAYFLTAKDLPDV